MCVQFYSGISDIPLITRGPQCFQVYSPHLSFYVYYYILAVGVSHNQRQHEQKNSRVAGFVSLRETDCGWPKWVCRLFASKSYSSTSMVLQIYPNNSLKARRRFKKYIYYCKAGSKPPKPHTFFGLRNWPDISYYVEDWTLILRKKYV